jgi:hypothetical protein
MMRSPDRARGREFRNAQTDNRPMRQFLQRRIGKLLRSAHMILSKSKLPSLIAIAMQQKPSPTSDSRFERKNESNSQRVPAGVVYEHDVVVAPCSLMGGRYAPHQEYREYTARRSIRLTASGFFRR